MLYQLNLREVTYALCEALDYVGIDDIKHGKRVAYIACEIAKKLGWRQSKLDKVLLMTMLHDCGVSSTDVHHSIVSHLDWEDSQIHCAQGAQLLQSVPIYSEFADIIAFHHTHWSQFLPQIDDDVKLCANLIYLSDRIDAMRSQFGAHLSHEKEYIRSIIQRYTPELFSPKISEAFLEISHMDSFWYYLDSDPLHCYFSDWIDQGKIETVPFSVLKKIASMFANIVDAKENIPEQHPSLCVASLARNLAEICNLSLHTQEEIELAALLQDLGRLRIPDSIYEKNITLSDDEQIRIRRQGFDTQIILCQIKGFEHIAKIISFYHKVVNERKGIACKVSAEKIISLEASILVIANTFQTFLQDATQGDITRYAIDAMLNAIAEQAQLETSTIDTIASYLETSYVEA